MGPAVLMVAVRLPAPFMLGYMALASGPVFSQISIILPVYILRTSLINSTRGLSRSILMDHVTKSHRGRWNAVESLCSFGWGGSAAVGGYLVDRYDYKQTFMFTAVLQLISILLTVPIAVIEVRERRRKSEEAKEFTGMIN